MRQLLTIFLLLAFAAPGLGQNPRLGHWCLGQGQGLDFATFPPTLSTSAMSTSEGTTQISGLDGELLCYYFTGKVLDRQNQVMPNGSDIRDIGWMCQGSIIVPKPGSSTLYYLFTMDLNPVTEWMDVYRSTIDMSARGGLGDVVAKNVLLRQSVAPGIAATHHANGQDIWLVLQGGTNDQYYAYRLTDSGIEPPVVSHLFGPHTQIYAKFAPDGKTYAAMLEANDYSWWKMALLDFDKASGLFSPRFELPDDINYGFAFSPDGTKFYYYSAVESELQQYDVWTQEKTVLAAPSFTTLQLASDGRIYLSGQIANRLWVIERPNLAGAACGVRQLDLRFNVFFYHFPTLLESLPGCPPLAGTYTIDPARAGESRNFASFTAAVEALICGGITDAVNFDVAAGSYAEQISIPRIRGSSPSDTITFRSATGSHTDVVLVSSGLPQGSVVELDSTAHLRFENLTLRNSSTDQAGAHTITFAKNCRDIVFRGNRLVGQAAPGGQHDITVVDNGPGARHSKLAFVGNLVEGATNAFTLVGDSLAFVGNTVRNFQRGGIVLSGNHLRLVSNSIATANRFSSSGISLTDGQEVVVAKNTISIADKHEWDFSGLMVSDMGDVLVANNFIALNGSTALYGIQLWGVENASVLHNTVHITGNQTITSNSCMVLYLEDKPNLIANNIFSSTRQGKIYEGFAELGLLRIDHNAYHTNGNVFADLGTPCATFAAWRGGTGPDAHSVFQSASFLSDADLHLLQGQLFLRLENPLPQVPEDIDGETRSPSNPYCGADEIAALEPLAIAAEPVCLGDLTLFALSSASGIASVLWSFGDGQTSVELEPAHRYALPGRYAASLQVLLSDGSRQTLSREVVVLARPASLMIEHE